MSQFHFGEGVKATLDFNGAIDGEPTISNVGVGTMVQDPKSEAPNAAGDGVETTVVLHFRNPLPGTAGFVEITGSALADEPSTADVQETVVINFTNANGNAVCEFIPPTQAKATSVTIATEAEAV